MGCDFVHLKTVFLHFLQVMNCYVNVSSFRSTLDEFIEGHEGRLQSGSDHAIVKHEAISVLVVRDKASLDQEVVSTSVYRSRKTQSVATCTSRLPPS